MSCGLPQCRSSGTQRAAGCEFGLILAAFRHLPFLEPLENGLLFAAKRLGDGRLRSEVLEEVLRCHATIFGVPIIEVKRISEIIFGIPIDMDYRMSDTLTTRCTSRRTVRGAKNGRTDESRTCDLAARPRRH